MGPERFDGEIRKLADPLLRKGSSIFRSAAELLRQKSSQFFERQASRERAGSPDEARSLPQRRSYKQMEP